MKQETRGSREGQRVLNKDVHVKRVSIGLTANRKGCVWKKGRRRSPVEHSIIKPWNGNQTRGARAKAKDGCKEEMDKQCDNEQHTQDRKDVGDQMGQLKPVCANGYCRGGGCGGCARSKE